MDVGEMLKLLVSQTFHVPTLGAEHHARRFGAAAEILERVPFTAIEYSKRFDVYPELLAALHELTTA